MKALIPNLLAVLALASLSSCETTGRSPQVEVDGVPALARVSGVWRFSHAGVPSISNDATKGLPAKTEKNMKDAKISIQENGEAAMVALGKSMAFKIAVIEETPLYMKLGAVGNEVNAYTYDKMSKLLMLSMDLDVDGAKGTMPAYFKRSR